MPGRSDSCDIVQVPNPWLQFAHSLQPCFVGGGEEATVCTLLKLNLIFCITDAPADYICIRPTALVSIPSLLHTSLDEISRGLEHNAFTSEQLVRAYKARIEEVNDKFHAVIELDPNAEQSAKQLDLERQEIGRRSTLHGIPVLLKDNIVTLDDTETTCGSTVLLGSRASAEAHIVDLLRKAGVVILGKANLSEFAGFRHSNAPTGWSARGDQATGIFWPGQKASGSSTGPAISVGLGLACAAFGTETVSSIVSPAEKSGVVGFKPTRDLTASHGIIPVSMNVDVVGPIATTVKDVSLITEALRLSPGSPKPESNEVNGLRGIRIGILRNPDLATNTAKSESFEHAIKVLQSLGAVLLDRVQLSGLKEYEALSDIQKTLVLDTDFKISMEAYLRSLSVNPHNLRSLDDLITAIKKDPSEQYPERDVSVMERALNTSIDDPQYASMIEREEYFSADGGLSGAMDRFDCEVLITTSSLTFQRFAAMGSNPAISVPMGAYPEGTPVERDKKDGLVTVAPGIPFSLYLYARKFDDQGLLRIAHAFEKSTQVRKILKPYTAPKMDLKDFVNKGKIGEKL